MNKRMIAVLFAVCILPALSISAWAQNPCDQMGSDCRVMTAAEVQAFKALILAIKAVLPVPDPARYRHNGAAEGSTMPFVAEANIPEAVPTCRAWPAGGFSESPYNTLLFGYDPKAKPEETKKDQNDPLAATQAMMAAFENRIEVGVDLFPHAFLVYMEDGKLVEISDEDAANIEKNATFLSWDSNEGTCLRMIFGPRTGNEEETLNVDKPARTFAPVVSIGLEITGPKAEVAALKKKIDRHAFEAFLGPVVK